MTEWCRAPEPRALLPRVADPSATTHGAETSGAPVLGATPDGDRRATTPAARRGRHALGSMACASPWTNDCLSNVGTSRDHKKAIRAAPRASVGLSPAFHPRAREVAVPRFSPQIRAHFSRSQIGRFLRRAGAYEVNTIRPCPPITGLYKRNFGFFYNALGKALFIIFMGLLCFGVEAGSLGVITGLAVAIDGGLLILLFLKYPHMYPKD